MSTTQLGLLPTAIRSFSTHQKLLQALSRVFTRWFATLFSALLLPLILSLNELYPVLYIYRAGKYTHSVQQQ